ncbi:hypothetical protein VCHA53O466_140154 [Vibrio chagasii]|nr:hypothetical protein VCHA53O466_140154 [Vibrio chagasii]
MCSTSKKVLKNVSFDDVVLSESGNWSQICEECQSKHPELTEHLSPEGEGACGVAGCNNPDGDKTLYVSLVDAKSTGFTKLMGMFSDVKITPMSVEVDNSLDSIAHMDKAERLELAKVLWTDFGNTPTDETEHIDEDWFIFSQYTCRQEIWQWFESKFDLCVAEDLMYVG